MLKWTWSVIETVNVMERCRVEEYDKVYCSITLHVYRNISQQLFYYLIKVCYIFPAILTIKTIDVTDGSFEIT